MSGLGMLGNILQFDSSKKDETWAANLIPVILTNLNFLIGQDEYDMLRSYAVGHYDTEDFKINFYDKESILKDDPSVIRIRFQPVDLLGVYRHVICSSIDKQPIKVEAKCGDETARSKMEDDIAKKIVYEQQVKPFLRLANKAIGANPNVEPKQEGDYNSNMEQTDAMGLNLSNPIDKAIWADALQRPKWEVGLETGIEHFIKLSDVAELRKKWAHDYFDCNVVCGQVYENSASGLPESSYLYPYQVFTVNASRPDRRDAMGVGYNTVLSVKKFLEMFVKEVEDESELNEILQAANIQSGTSWLGIWNGVGECPANFCSTDEFLGLAVLVGYVEWKTQNIDKYESTTEYGTSITRKYPADYEGNGKEKGKKKGKKKENSLETRFYEQIYSWYFLQANPVKVYGFGRCDIPIRKGTFNELSDFSIQMYFEQGQSLAERCMPYIKQFFDAWTKFQYFLLKARPSGTGYDFDAIYRIIQDPGMKSPDGTSMTPEAFVRFLEGSVDFLYKSARDAEGNALGGDGTPFKKAERGFDQTAWDLVKTMELNVAYIQKITGINEIRAAQQPQEGYKVSVFNLQRSQDATYFIDSGINKFLSNQSCAIGYKIQEIIYDNTFAYDSLVEAIGQTNVDNIASLDYKASQTFDIFIQIAMTDLEKVEVDAYADQFAQKGLISYGQLELVKGAGNYKLAKRLLAYFEAKALENNQKAALQSAQAAAAMEQMKHKNKMEEIDLEGKYKVKVAEVMAGTSTKNEQIKAQNKEKTTEMRGQQKAISQLQSHIQDKDRMQMESDLEPEDEQETDNQPLPPLQQQQPMNIPAP